jgi:hypothetical protein
VSDDYNSAAEAEEAVGGECQCSLIGTPTSGVKMTCPRCRVIASVMVALNKAERKGIAKGRSRALTIASEAELFLKTRPPEDPAVARLREAVDAFDVVERLAQRPASSGFNTEGGMHHARIEVKATYPDGNLATYEVKTAGVQNMRGPQRYAIQLCAQAGVPLDLDRCTMLAHVGILKVDGGFTQIQAITHVVDAKQGRVEIEFDLDPMTPKLLTRDELNRPKKLLYAAANAVVSVLLWIACVSLALHVGGRR